MKNQIHHMLAKTPLFIRVVSLYVLVGLVGVYVVATLPQQPVQREVVAMAESLSNEISVPEKQVIRGVPRQVTLPRLDLTKQVIDGGYDTQANEWTLTDDKVQYALMTESINDTSGQTLLYGHNSSAVFEPVKNVVAGDELYVTAHDGKVYVYVYSHDRFVEPTDISVLYESPAAPRVVLMTCEGWLSETRRLLYFDFKEVR